MVEDVPYIIGIDQYFGGEVTKENMHLLKAMGSSTAANGAVGLYHVENVTPDAKKKGRDLLVEGYQTYVVDDAEIERIYDGYPNLWSQKDAKPNLCFIGCPPQHLPRDSLLGRVGHHGAEETGSGQVESPNALIRRCPGAGTISWMSTRCLFAT